MARVSGRPGQMSMGLVVGHREYKDPGHRAHRLRRMERMDRLKDNPCSDCGRIFSPEAMDWDHRDPREKIGNVSQMLRWSWDKVLIEVSKCDLVCSNCHRVRSRLRANGG